MEEKIDTETLEAKLRNQLTPLYGLAEAMLAWETEPEMKLILINMAKQIAENKPEIDRILNAMEAPHKAVGFPYQTCPKCFGQGIVSKPPWVAGDVHEWSCSATSFMCDVCQGAKIIPMIVVPVNAQIAEK